MEQTQSQMLTLFPATISNHDEEIEVKYDASKYNIKGYLDFAIICANLEINL